ncbi:diacylglycerol kinase family protein [Thermopolyspora sp. NPDC052614]|uniref:diacylglycerol/lipid kinase family protein n=1 Tax=Thermopolyspora sp. NPDC052614 TaxID=3155682 RepID=UPI003413AFBA
MRALLLVNPKATTTTKRTRDVLIRALGAAVDLSVEETAYRGHAAALAETAREKGFDVVAVLGGDGTINETVNGLIGGGPTDGRPALMVIPGGSANVFARALGLPNNAVEATGVALEALREGRRRTINLGVAVSDDGDGRYFTFCAGVGYDAEVVRAVEALRGAGHRAGPFLYTSTAVRHYFLTDRRRPALRLERPRQPGADDLFMAIISNTAPWTYAGSLAINPTPWAGFDTGLDMLALRRMGLPTMLRVVPQILRQRDTLLRGRHLVQTHDEEEFTLVAKRPIAFQLDGDYLGERERVTFRSAPNALQVLV